MYSNLYGEIHIGSLPAGECVEIDANASVNSREMANDSLGPLLFKPLVCGMKLFVLDNYCSSIHAEHVLSPLRATMWPLITF